MGVQIKPGRAASVRKFALAVSAMDILLVAKFDF
jgi:hypothetical protein